MATKLPVFETAFDTLVSTSQLGEGGAGRVYAVNDSSGREWAVKCLAPENVTTERRKRFKNELVFCQRMDHPNIVRVVDTGVIEIKGVKCPFYVMPRYAQTLRARIGKIQPNQAMKLFSSILDGVEAAHLRGVWHRDLKPENILLDSAGESLVIADFGIAHFEEEAIHTAVATQVASRMANIQYASPEQRQRGSKVDHRADVYALGLMLNELFTGSVPHGTGYRLIGDIAPDYAFLDELVDAMMQNEQSKRLSSIEEVKKQMIGRKLSFVALQKLDEARRKVVPAETVADFDPLVIVSFDYVGTELKLRLNKSVPPGWSEKFRHPRGGYSEMTGYGPEHWTVRGNEVSIVAPGRESLLQQLLDHGKAYVMLANEAHARSLQERAEVEVRQRRHAMEKEVEEASLRASLLSKLKL